MKPGSVIVDVADNPIFVKHGVIHYSVANMPGAVAHTSTYALTNANLSYILQIADKGYQKAFKK